MTQLTVWMRVSRVPLLPSQFRQTKLFSPPSALSTSPKHLTINPVYIFILIAILTIAFVSIHAKFALHMPYLLPVFLGLHWDLVCGTCLLAVFFDPSVAYLMTRREVAGNGDGGDGDGSARVATVRQPLVVFEESRVNVLFENSERVTGWTWIEGVRYEEAVVEV